MKVFSTTGGMSVLHFECLARAFAGDALMAKDVGARERRRTSTQNRMPRG